MPAPQTQGRAYRERLHAALLDHPRLSPEALLDALAGAVEDDPVGVLRAISATLPKEAEIATAPQQNHLHLVRIVGAAQERGIDLGRLLEPSLPIHESFTDAFVPYTQPDPIVDEPDWLR
jgi:hypothetical protein